MEPVDTPGAATIEEVTGFLKVKPSQLVKTLIYMADDKPVAALVRGDRELNLVKLKNATGAIDLEMANDEQVRKYTGAPVGFAGPVGLKDVAIYVDPMITKLSNFIVGANENEKHILHVNIDRDFKATRVVDLSEAAPGDGCPRCEGTLEAKRGIEVGNTFMLGTKYSESLGARFLDADGKEHPILMGSYGIGVTRTPQAVLEKYHDANGIVWPKSIAPYLVEIVPVSMDNESHTQTAEKLYEQLEADGIDVLLDDRAERPGVKFKDADLIGIPVRITIGDKALKQGAVEMKARPDEKAELVPVEEVVKAVREVLDRLN
jgi:prolyl-tRNA synthetase